MRLSLLFEIFFALIVTSSCSEEENDITNNDDTEDNDSRPVVNSIMTKSDKLIGGEVATINEYPFIVSLQVVEDGVEKHSCGASFLDEQFVLTAAHCLCEKDSDKPLPIRIFRIVAGTTYSDEIKEKYTVDQIHIHPDYNRKAGRHDIGLLKLSKPIEFSPTMKAADLAAPERSRSIGMSQYNECTVAGWGKTIEDEPGRNRLLQVKLPLLSISKCKEHYTNVELDTDQVCTLDETGKSNACFGDPGAPLICNGTLIGVVSVDIGCASPNTPGVYTRVAAYADWLDTTREISLLSAGQTLVSDLFSFMLYLHLVILVYIS